MKKLIWLLFVLLLFSLGFLYLIQNPQLQASQLVLITMGLERLLIEETWDIASSANPASVFCVEKWWTSEIVTDANGAQSWLCHLADWRTCDERAYYSGTCRATATVLTWTEVATGTEVVWTVFTGTELTWTIVEDQVPAELTWTIVDTTVQTGPNTSTQ